MYSLHNETFNKTEQSNPHSTLIKPSIYEFSFSISSGQKNIHTHIHVRLRYSKENVLTLVIEKVYTVLF